MKPVPVTEALLRTWAPAEPSPDASKHDRGTALVVGGHRTTPGAVLLAGLAALRVGAGRLQVATDERVVEALGVTLPEALVTGFADVAELAPRADAVLVGPGLRSSDEAAPLLEAVRGHPRLVVDAAALGALTTGTASAVLTPNESELAALVGDGHAADEDPAVAAARRHGTTVLTRARTAAPDGRTWQDAAGGPELATSGSGDVLAGTVLGLLARGCPADRAAVLAGHLHAEAGRRASRRLGLGLLARELLDELPLALLDLSRSER